MKHSCRQYCFILILSICLLPAITLAAEDFRTRKSAADMIIKEDDVKAEIQFGREVAARILGRYPLNYDEQLTRYTSLVGKSIALYSSRPEIEFRFGILNTDSINAYASPGGYIFVTRGALREMKDESELAAVLAHEIAHVSERHVVKELNIYAAEDSPIGVFARLFGAAGDPAKVSFLKTVDKAMEILFERGYKMEDEREADNIGVILLRLAGYDPTALKRYLERIKEIKGEGMRVMNTHPSFDKRLKGIDDTLRKEGLEGLNYPARNERFIENVKIK